MNRLRRLFCQLAQANTPSDLEYRVMPFIMKKLFYAGFKVGFDKNYNIIAHRGYKKGKKLPVLCAHMDTKNSNKDKVRLELVFNSIKKVIHTSKCTDVLGGDDKCGIAIILRLAELAKRANLEFVALFTREEETGSGASKLNSKFYDMTDYGIVIDRMNSSDVVSKIYGTRLCTKNYEDWVVANAPSVLTPKVINSCNSDARPMSNYINMVNISCGYYEPHTQDEFVNIVDMFNSMIWVRNMLDNPYHEIADKKTV